MAGNGVTSDQGAPPQGMFLSFFQTELVEPLLYSELIY